MSINALVNRAGKPIRCVRFLLVSLTLLVASGQNAIALEVGESLPSLSFPMLIDGTAGEPIAMNEFRGKLIYLDIWASWCQPCRQSMPVLADLRREFGDRQFEVVAVNVDEKLTDALRFLRKTPVEYPILLDPKGTLPRAFSLIAMPTSYLIGPDGVVLYRHTGFKKSDIPELKIMIEAFLPE